VLPRAQRLPARDAVDANGNAIDGMRFDSLIEGRNIKTIDPHRESIKAACESRKLTVLDETV
jgi:hypothetical protein